jgi:hypothetical protein
MSTKTVFITLRLSVVKMQVLVKRSVAFTACSQKFPIAVGALERDELWKMALHSNPIASTLPKRHRHIPVTRGS